MMLDKRVDKLVRGFSCCVPSIWLVEDLILLDLVNLAIHFCIAIHASSFVLGYAESTKLCLLLVIVFRVLRSTKRSVKLRRTVPSGVILMLQLAGFDTLLPNVLLQSVFVSVLLTYVDE
jgi:hypothetical protein